MLKRTAKCGELTLENVGSQHVLCGWVNRRRNLGNLIFVTLRDVSGIIQIVFDGGENAELFELAEQLRSEYVIAVKGTLLARTPEMVNPNMQTGAIELKAEQLEILARSETPPFEIDDSVKVSDALRLKYRYLDLRRPEIQKTIIMKHKVSQLVYEYLSENGFLNIETPMLTKSTPEGARDYLVPSRVHKGKFYALPQSPQLFKQILMISGYDRYFQLARCFRDEDLRADRQPEFTQIDMEMSFVDMEDVMTLNEGLLKHIFKNTLGLDIETPFKRMRYEEAMDRYGSDKPDTRFGLELCNVSDIVADCGFKVFTDAVANGGTVRAINAKNAHFSRKEIDALGEFVKTYNAKGLAWINMGDEIKSSFTKFLAPEVTNALIERLGGEKGDVLLFVADVKPSVVFTALSALRIECGKRLNLIDSNKFNFLWVTEFPLFEYSEEEGRLVAMHHPFTAPIDEDLQYLESAPEKVHAKAYDIVLNGTEIGGGSIRIHTTDVQERMLEALKFTKEDAWDRFGFLLEALKFGAPPHGGLAYGLDRLVMHITGGDNIRDSIAFPKVQNASDLMSGAPDYVEDKQLRDLKIKTEE